MAYAYSKIDEMLGEDQGSSSIFGGEQEQTSAVSQFATPPGSDMVKTTLEGDIGGPSGGATAGPGSETDEIKGYAPTPVDQAEVFRRNIGKTKTPTRGLSRIGGKIQQSQAALQRQADEYTKGYKEAGKGYQLTKPTLEKAVGGERDAYGAVTGLLGRQAADDRPEFEVAPELYETGVERLGSRAGLQELAAEGQGPRYTRGMSAFDAMLMQRDPEFQKRVQGLQAQQRDLETELGGAEEKYETAAEEYGAQALTDAQEQAREYLRGSEAGLRAENIAEAQAYKKSLEDLDRDKIIADAYAQAQAAAGGTLGQIYSGRDFETSLAPYLEQAGAVPQGRFDPVSLEYVYDEPIPGVTFDPGDYSYRDFLDAQEADRFNRIMGLLGEGGEAYTAAGALGPQYTVDEQGLTADILERAAGLRQEADVAGQARTKEILAGASERAQAENLRQQQLLEGYDPALAAQAEAYLEERPEMRPYYSKDVLAGFGRPEFTERTGRDVMTAEEAEELNRIAADLGLEQQYAAGAGIGPDRLFEEQDFQDYLAKQLQSNEAATQASYIESLGGTPVVDPATGKVVAAEGTPVGRSITGETVFTEPGTEAEALIPVVGQTPIMDLPPMAIEEPAQFGGDIGQPAGYVDMGEALDPMIGQAIIPTVAPEPTAPVPVVGQTPELGGTIEPISDFGGGFGGAYDASSWHSSIPAPAPAPAPVVGSAVIPQVAPQPTTTYSPYSGPGADYDFSQLFRFMR